MRILNKHSASAANFAFNGCGKVFHQFIRALRVNGGAGALSKAKIEENKESSGMCTRHFLQVKSDCAGRHKESVLAHFTDKPAVAAANKGTRLFLKRDHEPSENTLNESPIQLLLRKNGAPGGGRTKISTDVDTSASQS